MNRLPPPPDGPLDDAGAPAPGAPGPGIGPWRDVPLAPSSPWGLGGPADLLLQPACDRDVAEFLRGLDPAVPVLWTGGGHDLLVRDRGFRGAVVRTAGGLAGLERLDGNEAWCGAGVACADLARQCAAWGLGSADFLARLPGTLGAALAGNLGAGGGETWRHVRSVRTVDRSGGIRERPPCDFHVGYRRVRGPEGEAFLGARLAFDGPPDAFGPAGGPAAAPGDGAEGDAPGPGERTCGPVFHDPPGRRAARLVREAGMAGHRVGGARVDPLRPDCLRVGPGACVADVERLVAEVRDAVLRDRGLDLWPRLRFAGAGPRPPARPAAPRTAALPPAPPVAAEDSVVAAVPVVAATPAPCPPAVPADPAPPPGDLPEAERVLAGLNVVRFRPGDGAVPEGPADGGPGGAGPRRGAFLCSRQLGCPANLALATRLHNYLTRNGWDLRDADGADCILFVACIILVDYRREVQAAVEFLARRHPGKPLYVTGCFAPEDRLEAPNVHYLPMTEADGLDAFFRPEVPLREASAVTTPAADRQAAALAGTRALDERPFSVLVATGCLRHCAYCVEPLLFPTVRSVPLDDVVAACREGVARGYRNFVVGASDVCSWGPDLGRSLPDLFAGLFGQVFGDRPDLGLAFKAFEPSGLLRHFDALRPYFRDCRIDWIYLPIESGSDRVLRDMRRPYRVKDVLDLVREIRDLAPALRIETDFVVAYPTETVQEFESSMGLLERFDYRNLVEFERHPGTAAAALADTFAPQERARRREVAAAFVRQHFHLHRFAAPPDDGPPEADEAPAPGAAGPAAFRVVLQDPSRPGARFDFTVSSRPRGARWCRAAGPFFLEADFDALPPEAVPLARGLSAAARYLADAPPSDASLPRWQALMDGILARANPGRPYRCTVTCAPCRLAGEGAPAP